MPISSMTLFQRKQNVSVPQAAAGGILKSQGTIYVAATSKFFVAPVLKGNHKSSLPIFTSPFRD